MKLIISAVTFNNEAVIRDTLRSILQSSVYKKYPCRLTIVDNSSTDGTPDLVSSEFPDVTLIHSENVGFGAGHNTAIREIMKESDYHLIVNPDVYFDEDAIEKLLDYMERDEKIGLIAPKLVYPDEAIQHTCRLLPTPFDLVVRRFLPGFVKYWFRKRLSDFELKHTDYASVMEAPNLCGCVMLFRSEVFETVGFFDDRFFMYLEDVDFTRRINAKYKTVYYPLVKIYHRHGQESYMKLRNLKYHIFSAVKYFNKWGWFFDSGRRRINRETLQRYPS